MRPQGRRGEVLADILTDFPEKFADRKQLWISPEGKQPREQTVEEHWFHKGRVVLKFAGVDSISSAEKLTGMLVQIPNSERSELGPGAVYVSDLVGSTLLDVAAVPARHVGVIDEVQQGVGEAPLLVVRNGKEEYEIPFAEEHVARFDARQKVLEMRLPSGLLEVNAPLSENEKREQRKR